MYGRNLKLSVLGTLAYLVLNTTAIDLQPIPLVDNVPNVSLGQVYANETISLKWVDFKGTVALILWATYSDRSGSIDLDRSNTKGSFDWTPSPSLVTEANSYHVEVWDWDGGVEPAGKDLSGEFVVRAARDSNAATTSSASAASLTTLSTAASTSISPSPSNTSLNSEVTSSNTVNPANIPSASLSTGAKAGIGIGASIGAILVIALLVFVLRRRARKSAVAQPVVVEEKKASSVEGDLGGFRSKGELDASEPRAARLEMEGDEGKRNVTSAEKGPSPEQIHEMEGKGDVSGRGRRQPSELP